MNLFRIPLNFYVIVVLLTLRYMNPFTVALIAGSMCFLAFFIGVYLCIYLLNHPELKKRKDEPIVLGIVDQEEPTSNNNNYQEEVKIQGKQDVNKFKGRIYTED